MAKAFGETGTFFIQTGNGKVKWSYKHEKCIECKTCEFKHKGRGLCTRCWDKQRDRTPKRKETKRKAGKKYHDKTYKPVVEKRLKWEYKYKILNILSDKEEIRKKASKKYYNENKVFLNIQARVKTMKQKGKRPIQVVIDGQTIELPFETLARPKNTMDPKYKKWVKNMQDLEELKKYFLEKKICKKTKKAYNSKK